MAWAAVDAAWQERGPPRSNSGATDDAGGAHRTGHSTPVAESIQQMLTQKRKRFVVVDEVGRPIGIVDRQMLLHAVAGVERANNH